MRHPIIEDISHREGERHRSILVTREPGRKPQRFCTEMDADCQGGCGLSALFLPPTRRGERAWRAMDSAVACGPVFQERDLGWRGRRVYVPKQYREDLGRRWWTT